MVGRSIGRARGIYYTGNITRIVSHIELRLVPCEIVDNIYDHIFVLEIGCSLYNMSRHGFCE